MVRRKMVEMCVREREADNLIRPVGVPSLLLVMMSMMRMIMMTRMTMMVMMMTMMMMTTMKYARLKPAFDWGIGGLESWPRVRHRCCGFQ